MSDGNADIVVGALAGLGEFTAALKRVMKPVNQLIFGMPIEVLNEKEDLTWTG